MGGWAKQSEWDILTMSLPDNPLHILIIHFQVLPKRFPYTQQHKCLNKSTAHCILSHSYEFLFIRRGRAYHIIPYVLYLFTYLYLGRLQLKVAKLFLLFSVHLYAFNIFRRTELLFTNLYKSLTIICLFNEGLIIIWQKKGHMVTCVHFCANPD
jgi:hypothetical protein